MYDDHINNKLEFNIEAWFSHLKTFFLLFFNVRTTILCVGICELQQILELSYFDKTHFM